MTLKFRNRFFIVLLTLFAVLAASLFGLFFYAVWKSGISFPNFDRFPSWVNNFSILSFNSIALFAAIFSLVIYAIVCIIIIVFNFEKTNSVEIIFFAGFLISCFVEGLRLIPPIFNLWKPLDGPILFCTRVVLAGRLFAPFAFVCAAIMKEEALPQDVEMKFFLGVLAATLVAYLVPVDSTKFTSTMLCFWGFSKSLYVIRALIFFAALVSLIIETKKSGEEELSKLPLWFLIMFAGYLILISCDTFFFLAPGVILIVFGTVNYLRAIHQNYLWS